MDLRVVARRHATHGVKIVPSVAGVRLRLGTCAILVVRPYGNRTTYGVGRLRFAAPQEAMLQAVRMLRACHRKARED